MALEYIGLLRGTMTSLESAFNKGLTIIDFNLFYTLQMANTSPCETMPTPPPFFLQSLFSALLNFSL